LIPPINNLFFVHAVQKRVDDAAAVAKDIFWAPLNGNGNFTYSQADEKYLFFGRTAKKCLLTSPVFKSLGYASVRNLDSDEKDALFGH
jgi:hypothetical protein